MTSVANVIKTLGDVIATSGESHHAQNGFLIRHKTNTPVVDVTGVSQSNFMLLLLMMVMAVVIRVLGDVG